VLEGFENAPAALMRLFDGSNRGKQLLRIAEPDLDAVPATFRGDGAP
jgi:hypothetical protein